MKINLLIKNILAVIVAVMLNSHAIAEENNSQRNLKLAEQYIDAFYSFNPKLLNPLLTQAGESQKKMLFYQGWAKDGNYIIKQRHPCKLSEGNEVLCSIRVQDDLVLALGIDFDVTDTFHVYFTDDYISQIKTSTDDPKLYHDAYKWVMENQGEQVRPACKGNKDVKPSPSRCVKLMLLGYQEYARVQGLKPRQPSSLSH